MNKDQKLIAEAYQKVLEQDYARFSGSDKLQAITPDNVEYVNTPKEPYDPRASKRREEYERDQKYQKERRKKIWVDISDINYIANLIKDNKVDAGHSFGIHRLSYLKPGDKKSQDFIMSLVRKDTYGDGTYRSVKPDEILKKYRAYVDPELQKQEAEREAQQQAQNTEQRSTSSKAMSETIKKLKQAGFKRGQSYKDEQGIRVVPMSKTIGSLLGGRQNKTIPVNPDGTIFKGEDVDYWLTAYGKKWAQGKKSLF